VAVAYLFSADFADDIDRARSAGDATREHHPGAGENFGENRIAHTVPDDETLLRQLRGGDESAFSTLFRIHTPTMYRVATFLLGSSDAASDVVQGVMQRVWRQRETLAIRGSIGGYLRAATLNAARNALRSESRSRMWVQRAATTLVSETRHPDEDSDDDALANAIARAITALPDRTREIFLLWWGGELSYAEIAETMGITVKGVERARARALDHLRAALVRDGFGPRG